MKIPADFKPAFDRLDAQKARSVDESAHVLCFYRGSENHVCAIGALIKDEFYSESFEGNTLVGYKETTSEILQAVEKSLGRNFSDSEIDILAQMQSVHDDSWDPDEISYTEAFERYTDSKIEFVEVAA